MRIAMNRKSGFAKARVGVLTLVSALAFIAYGPGSNVAAALDQEVGSDPTAHDEVIRLADFDYCKPTSEAPGHPHPQFSIPRSTFTQETTGGLTRIATGETCLPEPEVDSFTLPPGTNLLPTVYTDMYDGSSKRMPSTLPSTPGIPYNLHDGHPVVTRLSNARSPNDDLHEIIFSLLSALAAGESTRSDSVAEKIELAIDILEGNPIPDRHYSGFPLLHFNGPSKIRKVKDRDPTGTYVFKVKQIWYDEHIESDTAFIDPSEVFDDSAWLDSTWIIEYTVDVLNRGEDDFSPFVIYTDDPALTDPKWDKWENFPGRGRLPHIGMDQTFFPIQQGTRTVFRIKMAPGKYFKLSYTWGWRMHPPRIQVIEHALRPFPPTPAPTAEDPDPKPLRLEDTAGKVVKQRSLAEWERHVFGNENGEIASRADTVAAIAKIGDLSPAKRMWTAFHKARKAARGSKWNSVKKHVEQSRDAYFDWRTRSHLPAGVEIDPESDMTLLYVNNTIYGEFAHQDREHPFPEVRWPDWKRRGATLRLMLHNGDYYRHAYVNVDFGGARGWENQFKSSTKVGGSGCWFTFGRAHWMINTKKPVVLAAARMNSTETVKHEVHLTFNYEPSTWLRFYQFDPMHHDVAIFSIH